jgi:Tfp pilus assembly protein PilF
LWQKYIERADYVLLSIPLSDYVPWTPRLISFFNTHYLLVASQPRTFVYNHFDRVSTGAANTRLQQGIAALTKGETDQAKADFESVLAVDPADTDAIFDIGVIDARRGDAAAAAEAYTRALFLDPRFTPALFNLAVLETKTSPGVSIDLYRRILKIKPGDTNSEFNLGLLLYESGQTSAGEQLLHRAISADPGLAARLPAGIRVP